MPRVARIYLEEGVFHILARGNNKQWIFHDDNDFFCYKRLLRELKEEQPFKLYHYCLMNNHVHLLLEANPKTQLSRLIKRLNLSYCIYYKQKYGYAGHLWQDRFKSLLIEKDTYLLACGLYIERNPLRANMVSEPGDYLHSSYAYYVGRRNDVSIDCDPLYDSLGKDDKIRQKEYRCLTLDKDEDISENTFKKLFLGSPEFIQDMESKFDVVNTRAGKGRPKHEK